FANLSGANLSNANLTNTDLANADLSDANITNVDLSTANLHNTKTVNILKNDTDTGDGNDPTEYHTTTSTEQVFPKLTKEIKLSPVLKQLIDVSEFTEYNLVGPATRCKFT